MTGPGIQVGELVRHFRTKSRVVSALMRNVELHIDDEGASSLWVGDEILPYDGRNLQMLAGSLKVPYKYLQRESLPWQRQVIQHHTEQMADHRFLWYVEGSNVSGVYSEDAKIIPLNAVAERVANVFDPTDLVSVLYAPDQVEINVTSNRHTVTVPGRPGVLSRPMAGSLERGGIRVGDISCGGVRIIIQPGRPERAPVVEEFWERYVCTNGMTRRVSGSQINLRGRTVDEILLEMENTMRAICEGLEESGHAILESAETPVVGAVSDYLRAVARERNINAATILRLQDHATALPDDPTLYDVTQVVTALANEEGLPVLTRRNLQAIGGDLTHTESENHRCGRCERPFVAA